MKVIKTASGKNRIKMSKSEWTSIGKKAGWLKKANEGEEGEELFCQSCGEEVNYYENDNCPLCGGDMFAAEREDDWDSRWDRD